MDCKCSTCFADSCLLCALPSTAELWGKESWRYRQLWAAATEAYTQDHCRAIVDAALVLSRPSNLGTVCRALLAARGRRDAWHHVIRVPRKQLAAVR
jgi:hypothetical protein